MDPLTGELHGHAFYLPEPDWPPVYLQGDVLDNVPRVLMAQSDLPGGGVLDAPVVGPASYCHTRAMVVTPSCQLGKTETVQLVLVEAPPSPLSSKTRRKYMHGKYLARFLLPDLVGQGDFFVHLTTVWSVPSEHLAGLPRVAVLSAWGRHLLCNALCSLYGRPIIDTDYDTSVCGRCLP